ncbi:polysaccharide pyruvyl transferase family protein [Paraburkholderia diazotrophica]|uniref:Polysaccharide pyruvyl transferase family protein WcaK n=1 Tax=Paraburkholderia diazotrophica TaxID=667676 RepID=A0A1H7DZ17_9BURK|nr:polysaccharide pyruvyl transferase family protein [Paraburkholderia diazotrophica]SEK06986.1 Polysaccharide pyruvyl transferase family protein WcaK [Paraburkholderia diazotrophica]
MKFLPRFRKSRTSTTRIAFFGFYGRHNFGDDLFGYVLQHLCNDIPGIEARLVCASAKRELMRTWTLPVVKRWVYQSGLRGTVARMVTYCVALMQTDVVVFGGGSLFGAHASIAFARLISSIARALRKPVHALGVSVGPFVSERRRSAHLSIVADMTTIAVRDRASVRAVTSIPSMAEPANLGDLAFALPAIYLAKRVDGRVRTLVVSIHSYEYVEQVLDILANVDAERSVERVQFVSLDAESSHVAQELAHRFEPRHVRIDTLNYVTSIEEIIDALASAKCVVTSKLHGAITSHVYLVPAFLFCYQSKCADFLDDNDLPGPRDKHPASSVCVEVVRKLMQSNAAPLVHDGSANHYGEFKDFLECAAAGSAAVRSRVR